MRPRPGLFSTIRGWADPFQLLAREDPSGTQIASVLVQDEVSPVFSGAYLASRDGGAIVEGVKGTGDRLMLGDASPDQLPNQVRDLVRKTLSELSNRLGAIRAEWVFDGTDIWLLQLQQEPALSSGRTIVPGQPRRYIPFTAAEGIERLRVVIRTLDIKSDGIMLIGKVGMTTHLADLLRRANIPSFITEDPTLQWTPGRRQANKTRLAVR